MQCRIGMGFQNPLAVNNIHVDLSAAEGKVSTHQFRYFIDIFHTFGGRSR